MEEATCFLAGGRSDQTASSLRTEDQSAVGDPAVPWGTLLSRGVCKGRAVGRVYFCLWKSARLSLGFPRVPFLFL